MVPRPAPEPCVQPCVKHAFPPPKSPPRVLGSYYPSWKVYKDCKPSDLRIKLLTHVYYAFARLRDDGTVHSLDPKADESLKVDGADGCLRALTKLRKEQNPALRILLSIGGGSGSAQFPSVAADPVKTRRFCETARDFVRKFDLDGIDVDWEHPSTPAQGANFVHLLRALRSYLPSPLYTLTAALPAGEWCLRHIDLPALLCASGTPVLDFLHVMAYDFAGPWTAVAGHHAQLNSPRVPHNDFSKRSIKAIVRHLVHERGVSAQRIVIGVPVYGRSFLGVNGPGQKFSGHGGDSEGVFEFRQLPRPGTQEVVDRESGGAWCLGGDGGWISYDNPAIVAMKAEFVKLNDLGGLFFWTGSFDSPDDERSLVVAGRKALRV